MFINLILIWLLVMTLLIFHLKRGQDQGCPCWTANVKGAALRHLPKRCDALQVTVFYQRFASYSSALILAMDYLQIASYLQQSLPSALPAPPLSARSCFSLSQRTARDTFQRGPVSSGSRRHYHVASEHA